MNRQPRMIYQTQGMHFAQVTFDPDVTRMEMNRVFNCHDSHTETPGMYLTSLLKPDGSIVTYNSRKRGF